MKTIKKHLEWVVFLSGLILLGMMDPSTQSTSFCFFDFIGFNFCPGEGLGHSIAYTFRGKIGSAVQANMMGPIAILILSSRIIQIWNKLFFKVKKDDKV